MDVEAQIMTLIKGLHDPAAIARLVSALQRQKDNIYRGQEKERLRQVAAKVEQKYPNWKLQSYNRMDSYYYRGENVLIEVIHVNGSAEDSYQCTVEASIENECVNMQISKSGVTTISQAEPADDYDYVHDYYRSIDRNLHLLQHMATINSDLHFKIWADVHEWMLTL